MTRISINNNQFLKFDRLIGFDELLINMLFEVELSSIMMELDLVGEI